MTHEPPPNQLGFTQRNKNEGGKWQHVIGLKRPRPKECRKVSFFVLPFLTTLEAKSPKFENIISLFSYSLVCKHFLWLPTGSIEKQKQKHIYIFIKTKRKVCLDNKKTCFFSCPHTPPFFLVRNLFLRSPLDTTAPFFGCKMSTNSWIWSIHGRKFLIVLYVPCGFCESNCLLFS